MRSDCHMHMILDGYEWKAAIARHAVKTDDAWIRKQIETYQIIFFSSVSNLGEAKQLLTAYTTPMQLQF